MNEKTDPEYLGDGVTLIHENNAVCLVTEYGHGKGIYITPHILEELNRFSARIYREGQQAKPDATTDLLHACSALVKAARAMPRRYQHFIMNSIIEAELAIVKAGGAK